jgi:hypothetical protein
MLISKIVKMKVGGKYHMLQVVQSKGTYIEQGWNESQMANFHCDEYMKLEVS